MFLEFYYSAFDAADVSLRAASSLFFLFPKGGRLNFSPADGHFRRDHPRSAGGKHFESVRFFRILRQRCSAGENQLIKEAAQGFLAVECDLTS